MRLPGRLVYATEKLETARGGGRGRRLGKANHVQNEQTFPTNPQHLLYYLSILEPETGLQDIPNNNVLFLALVTQQGSRQ